MQLSWFKHWNSSAAHVTGVYVTKEEDVVGKGCVGTVVKTIKQFEISNT